MMELDLLRLDGFISSGYEERVGGLLVQRIACLQPFNQRHHPPSCMSAKSFQHDQPSFRFPASPPSSGNEAKARIGTPHICLADKGVMPATRPDVISDCVSLADKSGREVRAFVPEERAFDAFLTVRPVLGSSPNKDGVSVVGSKDDVIARPDKLVLPWPLVAAGVVLSIEGETRAVAIFGEEPQRLISHTPFPR